MEITFTWEAGEAALNTGTVTVSYHPVTDDLTKTMRYASGPTNDVIEIEDCITTLLFPYVTNQQGYDTGLVITNASEGKGDCTIKYSGALSDGSDAPDERKTAEPIAGGGQWVKLLSHIAAEFQGFLNVSCEFRDAHGFAFITDGDATLAQGYLAVHGLSQEGPSRSGSAREEIALRTRPINHRGVRSRIGLPYFLFLPRKLSLPPLAGGMLRVSIQPAAHSPNTVRGSRRCLRFPPGCPFRMRCHGSAHS